MICKPPNNYATAVIGAMVNGRVRSHYIASTFFDLAQRGYMSIVQEVEDLKFYRLDKGNEHLLLSEQLVLRDLFTNYSQTIPFHGLPPRLNKLMQGGGKFIKRETKQYKLEMKKDSKKRWELFAQCLKEDTQIENPNLFGHYFAYAVTFGLEVDWALRFTDASKASLPTWYETPCPEQQLGELVFLAQTISKLINKRAPTFSLPVQPGGFAHIGDR